MPLAAEDADQMADQLAADWVKALERHAEYLNTPEMGAVACLALMRALLLLANKLPMMQRDAYLAMMSERWRRGWIQLHNARW